MIKIFDFSLYNIIIKTFVFGILFTKKTGGVSMLREKNLPEAIVAIIIVTTAFFR